MPALTLGTGTFAGKGDFFAAWGGSDVAEATHLVDICLEAGLNMFDSAESTPEVPRRKSWARPSRAGAIRC